MKVSENPPTLSGLMWWEGSYGPQLRYQEKEPETSQNGQWADDFDFHEAIHTVT